MDTDDDETDGLPIPLPPLTAKEADKIQSIL